MSNYDRIHGGFFMGQVQIRGNKFYRSCLQASSIDNKIDNRKVLQDNSTIQKLYKYFTADRRKKISFQDQFYGKNIKHGGITNINAEIKVVIHHKKFAIEIKLERGLTISEIQFMQSLIVGYIFATDPHLIGKKMPKVLFWQGIQNIAE